MSKATSADKKLIGEIGEYIAWKELTKNGFKLYSYGGEMMRLGNNYKHKRPKIENFTLEEALSGTIDTETEKGITNFHEINNLISKYIANEWERFSKELKMPFATYEIAFTEKKGEKELANLMRKENINSLNRYRFSGGDKFDYVGLLNGKPYAIEVKVNSSKLLEGQKFRLKINRDNGFNIILTKIHISDEQLQHAKKGNEPEGYG